MIYLASDHAGFEMKTAVAEHLAGRGLGFVDMGPFSYDPQDDYPDYVIPAALKVAESPENMGIVMGGSGQGEAIAANKIRDVRAVVYYGGPHDIIRLSREHNKANILSLGARFMTPGQACYAVELWLGTEFLEGRHARRIEKISMYER